ncbi:hypothetical protein ACRAKI_16780 [Saccharothrix isguenensis]
MGSGFGGSVAALRLGRAGVRALVLERGKWWPSGPGVDTFPPVLLPGPPGEPAGHHGPCCRSRPRRCTSPTPGWSSGSARSG